MRRAHPIHDRNLLLDQLVVRNRAGEVVHSVELESLSEMPSCGHPESEEYMLYTECGLDVPVTVPSEGAYRVEVLARQQAAGDGPARLRIQGKSFDVNAEDWDDRQAISAELTLAKGRQAITLEFENDYWRSVSLWVNGVVVRNEGGQKVQSFESDSLRRDCAEVNDRGEADLNQWEGCSLKLAVPDRGIFQIEVTALKRYADMPLSLLEIVTESRGGGRGEKAIRGKIAELHRKLYGVSVPLDSPGVDAAYQLFLKVWERKRLSGDGLRFLEGQNCKLSGDHYFFEGIAEIDEGEGSRINWDRANELFSDDNAPTDPYYASRTWVVVLSYLLTDYRYLYL